MVKKIFTLSLLIVMVCILLAAPMHSKVMAASGTGRCASFVIAASNSLASSKAQADYVCDGVSDQVEIQSAISSLTGGGEIRLLEGLYILDQAIAVSNNVTVSGCGAGTVLKIKDNLNAEVSIFTNTDFNTTGNERIVIRDVRLDGNRANNPTGTTRGIYFKKVAPSPVVREGFLLEGCIIDNCQVTGIQMLDCHNSMIRNNLFRNDGNAFEIYQGSSHNTVANNICNEMSTFGFQLNLNACYNTIIGNVCRGNLAHGIQIYNDCNYNVLANNVCQGNNNSGIHLYNARYNVVEGNSCQGNGQHGINIEENSNNNLVSGNSCVENSQVSNNSHDNIRVANSDNNVISSNVCRQGDLANKTQYGINISDNNSDRNYVKGNDLYSSGATGDLNDMATTNPTLKHDNRNNAGTGWIAEF